jgi:hypothetical protein
MFLLFTRGECRADLFAVGTLAGELHRIDADTGQLLNSYLLPTGPIGSPSESGLAFDGRIVYLSRNVGGPTEVLRFDAVTETWLPPAFISPFPGVDFVAGLGFLRRPDFPTLIGVAWNITGDVPLEVVEIQMFDTFGFTNSFASLPPNLNGMGLDVDPETGEIWVATRVSMQMPPAQSLFRLDSEGNVLAELPYVLGPPPVRIARGLGFDEGRLFVADTLRTIYELNRTDGSIIRSFTLPVDGPIGALTGGRVVPEPSSATIAVLIGALFTLGGRNRRQ